jgi:hypothetical protein
LAKYLVRKIWPPSGTRDATLELVATYDEEEPAVYRAKSVHAGAGDEPFEVDVVHPDGAGGDTTVWSSSES